MRSWLMWLVSLRAGYLLSLLCFILILLWLLLCRFSLRRICLSWSVRWWRRRKRKELATIEWGTHLNFAHPTRISQEWNPIYTPSRLLREPTPSFIRARVQRKRERRKTTPRIARCGMKVPWIPMTGDSWAKLTARQTSIGLIQQWIKIT